MKRVNEVTEELESMGSVLAGMSRAMPFFVPQGYFEQLEAGSLQSVRSITVNGSKAMPYAVPQDYFEGLAGNVMAAVDNESFVSSKTMPYRVPAGYFECLTKQVVTAAIGEAQESKKIATKVIPLGQSFSRVRWAVAAVLLVCISLGGYISFFSSGQTGTENELASLSKEEIQDYLQYSDTQDENRIVYNSDINQLDIDNKDIVQYLDETGWDVVD